MARFGQKRQQKQWTRYVRPNPFLASCDISIHIMSVRRHSHTEKNAKTRENTDITLYLPLAPKTESTCRTEAGGAWHDMLHREVKQSAHIKTIFPTTCWKWLEGRPVTSSPPLSSPDAVISSIPPAGRGSMKPRASCPKWCPQVN